ncbi:MAG TPA: four helix bundle protein [Candidatus Paceibacterota bacterium]|jgi:four helix bundle protein|nr:four helix bundle protein [Smithellaceae bacterium]HQI26330.1 four helix bundle protein [Candidatus Paceibacterota bacterium]
MANNRYRDLLIWQKSLSLIKEIYTEAEKLPKTEEYNLKQQLKRAVVSVALNIAEGKNRRTSKDFINFLNIAKGSLAETEAVLLICEELKYLQISEDLFARIEELAKMINSLITTIKKKSENA